MAGLHQACDGLHPTTLRLAAERSAPAVLDRLHPGSWINGTFATWIGHPEKTAAWRLLADVRSQLEASGTPHPPSLLVAEASDWFWWLGDDNPTELAPLYDTIFRRHLSDACRQAGIATPGALDHPLKLSGRRVAVPVSRHWRPPTLDGRMTSYFEWCFAVEVELGDGDAVDRLALWSSGSRLYLYLDGVRELEATLADSPLTLCFEDARGTVLDISIGTGGAAPPSVEIALDQAVELALPWDAGGPARLHLHAGDRSLVEGSVLVLEPMSVDEPTRPDED
jgi:hypothetical protein